MKKNPFFLRLRFALLALLFVFCAQLTNAQHRPPAHSSGGCLQVGNYGRLYIKMTYDNTTYSNYGSNMVIWIAWGGNYLGPLSPVSVVPNPSSPSNWDYLYDLSPYSYLNLPWEECYTVYYFYTGATYGGYANPSQYAWSKQVCPCPDQGPVMMLDCIAEFYHASNGFSPSTFNFHPGSLNPSVLNAVSNFTSTYEWDFGDGTTSTLEHPVHTYTATGTYTVCLTQRIYENGLEIADCTYCLEICVTQLSERVIEHGGAEGPVEEGRIQPAGKPELSLTPNPATNMLKADVAASGIRKAEVIILDAMGNTRHISNTTFTKDKHSIDIDTQMLPVGTYTLYIKSADGILSSQFNVVR